MKGVGGPYELRGYTLCGGAVQTEGDRRVTIAGEERAGVLAKLQSVAGQECHRALPEGGAFVEEDVGGAGGRELRCRDAKHIDAAAEAAVEEQSVHVPARCDR